MTEPHGISADAVMQSADQLKNLRPAYQELLTFFEAVFLAQEASAALIQIESPQISPDILKKRMSEKFPILDISEFVIDTKASLSLMNTLCDIAKNGNKTLRTEAVSILQAIESGRLDPLALFDYQLKKHDALPALPGVSSTVMNFLGYNSILPSLAACSHQASVILETEDPWKTGYCPICGSMPGLSTLEKEGERSYVCSFCRHVWAAPRLFCAFCSNTDGKTLHYIYSDQESEYRVDACDVCNRYIKTIDMRKTSRRIYPPLEMIATIHLDILASDAGLAPVYDWNPMGL
ncbi:MAG: formate dehydrogenase accessory protein FdhE [Desulfatirhabdiaceae bacterium]